MRGVRGFISACGILCAALALPGTPALSQGNEPVTIGAVEILTGPNNKYGIAIKNGFDLALDEVNKAGGVLGGRPLQIAYEDLVVQGAGHQCRSPADRRDESPADPRSNAFERDVRGLPRRQ